VRADLRRSPAIVRKIRFGPTFCDEGQRPPPHAPPRADEVVGPQKVPSLSDAFAKGRPVVAASGSREREAKLLQSRRGRVTQREDRGLHNSPTRRRLRSTVRALLAARPLPLAEPNILPLADAVGGCVLPTLKCSWRARAEAEIR
jgi:hypothetical protein